MQAWRTRFLIAASAVLFPTASQAHLVTTRLGDFYDGALHPMTGFEFALPWLALAVVISLANTALELFSPRSTDDFTMATANALLCWAFGALVY